MGLQEVSVMQMLSRCNIGVRGISQENVNCSINPSSLRFMGLVSAGLARPTILPHSLSPPADELRNAAKKNKPELDQKLPSPGPRTIIVQADSGF